MPRSVLRALIIAFCLYHMTAVAAYSVSTNWRIALLTYMREKTLPYVRGYTLMTSQWQQWNLFSPDPIRRVSRYRIGWEMNGKQVEGHWIDEGLSYHHSANIMKTLRRLEEHPHNDPLLLRFLALTCRNMVLPAGTPIHLERHYYVLPQPEEPLSRAEWKSFAPQWAQDVMAESMCPTSS